MLTAGARVLLWAAVSMLGAACGGPPCKSQGDCALGSYCVLDVSGPGTLPEGECVSDCESHEDCPVLDPNLSQAICTNEGKCRTIARPPKLRVFEPETDTVYPEGTRSIRVSGEVVTAAERVTLTVGAVPLSGCAGASVREVKVENPNPGTFATLPFVIDDVDVDPGRARVSVGADVGGTRKTTVADVSVLCEGCAEIAITTPGPRAGVLGLELRTLQGTITPPVVDTAIWRVFSYEGAVIDGSMSVGGGSFLVERLPLFPGLNRVEVVVSGVGEGLGESRCSALISSATTTERGLRTILIWDGPTSDFDLHIIGPGGHFGDPTSTLSSRGRNPTFGGTIDDDSEGFGPEVARIDELPDGVYGIVVEPVVDGGDFGADAFVRMLYAGRPLVAGPVGPRHLTSLGGKLWVAGTVRIENDTAAWTPIDALVSAANPPVTAPDRWPQFE